MRIEIDWKALIFGGGITFFSVLSLFWLLSQLGYLPRQDPPVRNLNELYTDPTMLFFMVSTMPGSITAGYLHSSNLFSGAIYGMAVVIIGYVLPIATVVTLFLGLIGLLGGEPGIVFLTLILLGLGIPGFIVIVTGGGIIGGVIGSLLRGWRTN